MVVGDGAELDVGPPLVVLQAQGESRVFCQRGDGEWDDARSVGLYRDCGAVKRLWDCAGTVGLCREWVCM